MLRKFDDANAKHSLTKGDARFLTIQIFEI